MTLFACIVGAASAAAALIDWHLDTYRRGAK